MKWLIVILSLLPTLAFADLDTIEVSATSSHDAAEFNCGGFSITQDHSYCGWFSGCAERLMFLFVSVGVAQGATINSAKIRGYLLADHTGTPDFNVNGEDTSSATAFSDYTDWTNRQYTSAFTDVNGYSTVDNQYADLATITSVIQELVDRGDWSTGNNMAIYMHGQNGGSDEEVDIEMTDGGEGNNMLLIIDHTPPAVAAGPPIPTESPRGGRQAEGPDGSSWREGPG